MAVEALGLVLEVGVTVEAVPVVEDVVVEAFGVILEAGVAVEAVPVVKAILEAVQEQ